MASIPHLSPDQFLGASHMGVGGGQAAHFSSFLMLLGPPSKLSKVALRGILAEGCGQSVKVANLGASRRKIERGIWGCWSRAGIAGKGPWLGWRVLTQLSFRRLNGKGERAGGSNG